MKMKAEAVDAAMWAHFAAVGCADTASYRAWCEREGLRYRTQKGAHERAAEVRLYRERRATEALRTARSLQRRPDEVLRAVVEGQATPALLRRPELAELDRQIRTHGGVSRKALLTLLVCVHARGTLLRTHVGGLVALARLQTRWRRTPESWRPERHGGDAQFAALARHLLAQWDVPAFLDSAFFRGDRVRAKQEQAIWLHVADGKNLRTAPHLPVVLTKRAAHLAHTVAPADLSVFAGLRWAQVRALGLSERAARALVGTLLGEPQADEAFWSEVVAFFARNPLLDPAHYGPLADYLRYERTAPRATGDATRLPVGFTMQGRTPQALLTRVEDWHRRLTKEAQARIESWPASGIEGLDIQVHEAGASVHWRLSELTTSRALVAEGRAMAHCIATYALSCARGGISVWSLTRKGPMDLEPVRVMTIAMNRNRQITEARGKRNALPSAIPTGLRLAADDAALLARGRRFVQRWAVAHGLTLPPYLVG